MKVQDLFALSSDLDAHVLDFGAYVFYPHIHPAAGRPLKLSMKAFCVGLPGAM